MEDKILEQILDENIPRELLNAYTNSRVNAYNSEQHPGTSHNELSSTVRRSKNWDYGKASYDKISVEDALELIDQDPHNVEKIRGIRNGKLVEYEYKNGKFYNIYGDPDDPVEYADKRGNTVSKRNIRYITNPKIWLPLLDTIYVTDEYDHDIRDTYNDRQAKNQLGSVHTFISKGSDSYDRYSPASSFAKNPLYIGQKDPDTGDHDYKYLTNMKNPFHRPDFTSTAITLPDNLKTKVTEYIRLKEVTKVLYNKYDISRRALKKLDRERYDYDVEEYEELKERWITQTRDLLNQYNEAMRNLRDLEVQVKKHMTSVNDNTNNKLMNMFSKYETLINQFTDIKNQLGRLKITATGTSTAKDTSRYNRSEIQQQIINLDSAISNEINTLKDIEDNIRKLADSDPYYPRESDELDAVTSEIDKKMAELAAVKKAYIKEHIKKYRELEATFNQIKDEIDALRPHDAARAAARKIAAGEAELDPAVTNLITFTDFEGDLPDDEESASA